MKESDFIFGENILKEGRCRLTGKKTKNMLNIRDEEGNVINLVYIKEEEFRKLPLETQEKIYKAYQKAALSVNITLEEIFKDGEDNDKKKEDE